MASSCRVLGSGTWSGIPFAGPCTSVIGAPSDKELRATFVTDRPSAILAAPYAEITTIGAGPFRGAVPCYPVRPKRTEFKNKYLQAENGMRCRVAQTEHHILATLISRSTIRVRMDHWVT